MNGKAEFGGAPVRKHAQDARQGRPGGPVLFVLIAGTLLGLAALLFAYLSVNGTA